MKPVCVLGNGQLGRMLRQAGEPLGIAVYPVGIDAEPEAVPYQNSVITAEIERWPETALTRELATHSAFVTRLPPSETTRIFAERGRSRGRRSFVGRFRMRTK